MSKEFAGVSVELFQVLSQIVFFREMPEKLEELCGELEAIENVRHFDSLILSKKPQSGAVKFQYNGKQFFGVTAHSLAWEWLYAFTLNSQTHTDDDALCEVLEFLRAEMLQERLLVCGQRADKPKKRPKNPDVEKLKNALDLPRNQGRPKIDVALEIMKCNRTKAESLIKSLGRHYPETKDGASGQTADN